MQKALLILICSCFVFSTALAQTREFRQEPFHPLLACWQNSYQEKGVDFIGEMKAFEKLLLNKSIIKDTTASTYRKFKRHLMHETEAPDLSPLTIEITRYLSPAIFQECVGTSKASDTDNDYSVSRYGLLFSIYFVLSAPLATLELHLTQNNKAILEGKEIELNDLVVLLESRKKELSKQGVPADEVILKMKVDLETKMGFVTDVQEKLKDASMLKIQYVVPD